jgi:putative peptidoglycan lipid II flippase
MVNSILNLLATRQTTILSGAFILMATMILSKALGLVRDRLLAHIFPTDTVAIFFAAFGLPDLIFQIFVFGALSVAFIPVFTEYYEGKGKTEAFRLASSILNLSLLILITLSVIIYIFADYIIGNFIVPGFTTEQKMEVATLTKVILIGQIILAVGSFFIGILQSFQRFIFPALAGVFYNIGIILGIIIFSSSLGIMGAAVGVIIGALLHVLIQLPLVLSMGFKWRFRKNIMHDGVKDIVKLMSVRTIGLAAEQINDRVAIALASLISTSSVTYLTFAQHLQVVPIGLFGTTLAQAALPVMSYERARGRIDEFKTTLLTTMHQILFLALPATAILMVLRIPSVRLIFGASQFDWEATVLTGRTLSFLAIGLSAQAVSLLFIRGFYALKDTKTPVIVSLITVTTNIVLSIYFTQYLKLEVWSLGLAFSISTIISGLLLFITLHFKVGKFNLNQALTPFLKMLMATIIMGVALYIPIKLLDQVIFDTTKVVGLVILTGLASSFALAVYLILVWYLKVKELNTYVALLKKVGKIQEHIKSKEVTQEPDSF